MVWVCLHSLTDLCNLPAARARGEYLRTHFKNMREVAAALSGSFVGDNTDFCISRHTPQA